MQPFITQSFANNWRTNANGTLTRERVPEEIRAYGFKPPVVAPDGSVQRGDYLAHNWLNFLINDVWRNRYYLSDRFDDYGVVQFGNKVSNWQITDKTSSGVSTVSVPIPFKDASQPAVFTMAMGDSIKPVPSPTTYTPPAGAVSGSIGIVSALNGVDSPSGSTFVIAFGDNSNPAINQATKRPVWDSFCDNSLTYTDGQPNMTEPTSAQITSGFAPPYVNAQGVPIIGDQLSATTLNWIFNQLYRTPGLKHGDGFIQVADLLIQYGNASVSADGTEVTFSTPFKNGTVPVVLVQSHAASAADVSLAVATHPAANPNASVSISAYRSGADAVAVGTVSWLAFGVASDGAFTRSELTTFAATQATYPDGSVGRAENMEMSATDQLLGYKPSDMLTAQEFNLLLHELTRGQIYTEYSNETQEGSQAYKLRIGGFMLQAFGASVPPGGGSHTILMPEGLPQPSISMVSTRGGDIGVYATAARTGVSLDLLIADYSGDNVTAATNHYLLTIGEAP